jgi:translocation and assembly module TamB
MNWNRAALLARRIDIRELSAERITLLRPPVAADDAPSPEATPFALPKLPVAVNVGSLSIGRITLAAPVLGQDIALSLTGNVALGNGTLNTRLSASRADGHQGDVSLIAAYSEASRVLSVVLKAEEAADGLIANLTGLPGKPSLSVQVAGTGPIDAYRATLLVATDGTNRLTGEATLAATPAGASACVSRATSPPSSCPNTVISSAPSSASASKANSGRMAPSTSPAWRSRPARSTSPARPASTPTAGRSASPSPGRSGRPADAA